MTIPAAVGDFYDATAPAVPADLRVDDVPLVVSGVSQPDPAETQHLMVDIETLGSRPGAAIVSIGAVVFTPSGVTAEFECAVDTQSCVDAGLRIDVDTVLWWFRQSSDAIGKTFFTHPKASIADALGQLSFFAASHGVVDYWSHGATFDLVLLNEASLITGAPQLIKDFRRARDTRTLYEITGVNPKTFMGTGTAHNAVDDARAQALAVIESWRIIRRWRTASNESFSSKAFNPWGGSAVN